ncbi:thiamine phosphate synthase [Sediminitomix flava]|uniref:Thiamine-phosphate pyrophosphorylase n=1 Tax=Sediminitomix flava TaxID=379075 RepID=A0A315Z7V4_SEDFL|nr:thiamine phosphate synthase [Sediminitomix flava]PWJ41011.1 thiamine-phosphate pyrophosphorylase [Sediminitomix flava]
MNIILISSPEEEKKELEKTTELFKSGLTKLHLRKPKWNKEEYRRFIEKISPNYHPHIILHQFHELLDEFDLGGIHYSEKTRPERQELDLHCSTSFHQLEQLEQDWGSYNYVFLSPIFDSISKVGYKSYFKPKELKSKIQTSRYPVVALGGITPYQIQTCKDLGFDGVAVLGYVWASENPLRAYQELIKSCQ